MIKAVIFDINGVVVSPRYDKIYRMLRASARKLPLMEPVEDAIMKKIIRLYRDERSVNHRLLDIVGKLNSMGIMTPALTNSPNERKRVFEKLGIVDRFKPFLVSEDLDAKKPDRKAYEMLLERIGLRAEECVFVDDSRPNLDAARGIGFKTILYRGPEHMKRKLREYGIGIE